MRLGALDIAVIVIYFVAMIWIGLAVMRRASKNLDTYFLAGNSLPWWVLGISNASAMFDITGTMWLVYNVFVYGLKGTWLPWLWPTFNQVFLMIYLAVWIRRSNVLTGAEWITTRFGDGRGAELARGIVVLFAIVSVVGFISYDFQGMGKFSKVFLPWDLSPNTYAVIVMSITAIYVVTGGMLSVVLTDVAQFVIMAASAVVIAVIAMSRVDAATLAAHVPANWNVLSFGWRLDLDWSHLIPALQRNLESDGYTIFGLFFIAMMFKGVLVSIAGPAPNYDMQRILAAKSPREAALMSASVSMCLAPRWLMVGGITTLALVFLGPQFATSSTAPDFEMVLPYVIRNFIPAGFAGLLLAGLLAAFMSTFSATINAGSAYLVNDLYKRYLRPSETDRHYVIAGYVSSVLVLIVGVIFGYMAGSINQVTQWIVSGLFGGYTAANVLKWHWYRLNGYGYFWGMGGGIGSALLMPLVAPAVHPLNGFPVILAISIAGCVLGSLLTPAEPDAVLVNFYTRVRPWGVWGPVLAKAQALHPDIERNRNFARDMTNSAVAVIWQFTLVTGPLYLCLWDMRGFWISVVVFIVLSVFLKVNWYDKLDAEPVAHQTSIRQSAGTAN
jgi:solute:Na+ symporter, SSS family